MTESLAEYDRQQDTLLKENKRLLKENEDLEVECDKVKREERDSVFLTHYGQIFNSKISGRKYHCDSKYLLSFPF